MSSCVKKSLKTLKTTTLTKRSLVRKASSLSSGELVNELLLRLRELALLQDLAAVLFRFVHFVLSHLVLFLLVCPSSWQASNLTNLTHFFSHTHSHLTFAHHLQGGSSNGELRFLFTMQLYSSRPQLLKNKIDGQRLTVY